MLFSFHANCWETHPSGTLRALTRLLGCHDDNTSRCKLKALPYLWIKCHLGSSAAQDITIHIRELPCQSNDVWTALMRLLSSYNSPFSQYVYIPRQTTGLGGLFSSTNIYSGRSSCKQTKRQNFTKITASTERHLATLWSQLLEDAGRDDDT